MRVFDLSLIAIWGLALGQNLERLRWGYDPVSLVLSVVALLFIVLKIRELL